MPTILLIRHAQASFGAEDYDVLSELGHRQSGILDDALSARGIAPARVVTGTAVRHRDTAAGCPRTVRDAPEIDPRWDEYSADHILTHHADTAARLDGSAGEDGSRVTSKEFQALLDPAMRDWIAQGASSPSPQTWPGYLGEVTSALDELAASLDRGETAVVFTSAGAIAAACASLLGRPDALFIALNRVQVNTAITKIAHGASGSSLVSFNEHGHLDVAGRELVSLR